MRPIWMEEILQHFGSRKYSSHRGDIGYMRNAQSNKDSFAHIGTMRLGMSQPYLAWPKMLAPMPVLAPMQLSPSWYFPEIGGPQYRIQNNTWNPLCRAPKRAPAIVGEPPGLRSNQTVGTSPGLGVSGENSIICLCLLRCST